MFSVVNYKMNDLTLDMIKAREQTIREDLEKLLVDIEEPLRVNIMAHVTALLVLGILEGRRTPQY